MMKKAMCIFPIPEKRLYTLQIGFKARCGGGFIVEIDKSTKVYKVYKCSDCRVCRVCREWQSLQANAQYIGCCGSFVECRAYFYIKRILSRRMRCQQGQDMDVILIRRDLSLYQEGCQTADKLTTGETNDKRTNFDDSRRLLSPLRIIV